MTKYLSAQSACSLSQQSTWKKLSQASGDEMPPTFQANTQEEDILMTMVCSDEWLAVLRIFQDLGLPVPPLYWTHNISSHSSRCQGQRDLLRVSTGRRNCSVLSCGRSYLLSPFLLLVNSPFLIRLFFSLGFHMVMNCDWMLSLTNGVLAECILSHLVFSTIPGNNVICLLHSNINQGTIRSTNLPQHKANKKQSQNFLWSYCLFN